MSLLACQPGDHTHDHAEDTHAGEEEAAMDEVHLVQKQMDVMGIKLGPFQYLNLSTTVKANGHLELPPQNKASLSAVMAGRVTRINVLEGDYVRKGKTLAMLENPVFVEMQQDYLSAKSRLAFLESDFLRKKNLYADSIASAKAFEEAEAQYLGTLSDVNGLRARLQMLDIDMSSVEAGTFSTTIPVRSPINGYVRLVEINMGKYVQPEQEMFEIVDNEHIHIDLMVYEKDMDRVHNGQKVVFTLSNKPDSVFQGSIFAVGKAFEQEPKAMAVHAEIDNKRGNLLPGMYVDARIITEARTVQAVPNDALVRDGGLNYIFALDPDLYHAHDDGEMHMHTSEEGHEEEYVFRKIEVSTGASDIGFTEAVPVETLPDSVLIVTHGAYYLLAEMKKGTGEHGHHH